MAPSTRVLITSSLQAHSPFTTCAITASKEKETIPGTPDLASRADGATPSANLIAADAPPPFEIDFHVDCDQLSCTTMPGRIVDNHCGGNDDQGPHHPRSDDVGSSTEHNNEPLIDEREGSVSQDGNEGHLSASGSGNHPGTSGSRSPAPEARIPGDSARAQNGSNGSMTEDSRNESEQRDDWNINRYLRGPASTFLESELGHRAPPPVPPLVNDLPGVGGSSHNRVPSSAASDAPMVDTHPGGGLDNRFVNGDGPNPVDRPNQVGGPGAYYRVDVSLDSDSDVAQDDNPRGPETTSHGSG